jgi:histidyl-tRNA synthetase
VAEYSKKYQKYQLWDIKRGDWASDSKNSIIETMKNVEPRTLKGFRDFLPAEARKRQYVMNTLQEVFTSYGFEPLETPVLEYEEILAGKYGDEGDQLMYRFTDRGERNVAMRYDQTVPLARVVAQFQNELPTPFKRYQVQNVWRAENTQKGRYREFLQCDIDTVGVDSPLADAEIIATAAAALEKLGFEKYKIIINDRRVFSELVEQGKVSQEEMGFAVVAVDKLKKIGEEGVVKELVSKGLNEARAKEIFDLIRNQEETDTLRDIGEYLKNFNFDKAKFKFDPTLARGLNYYTGVIFEIEIEGYDAGSVCGGGRYNNLIGMFANQQFPAVGCAFGFDRLLEAMEAQQLFPNDLALSSTQVLVTIFTNALKEKSLEVCSLLRSNNINTEIYLGEIKEKNPIEKQLKYAIQKNIPYMVIIGSEEAEKNMVTLKNMQTREQRQIAQDQLVEQII